MILVCLKLSLGLVDTVELMEQLSVGRLDMLAYKFFSVLLVWKHERLFGKYSWSKI